MDNNFTDSIIEFLVSIVGRFGGWQLGNKLPNLPILTKNAIALLWCVISEAETRLFADKELFIGRSKPRLVGLKAIFSKRSVG